MKITALVVKTSPFGRAGEVTELDDSDPRVQRYLETGLLRLQEDAEAEDAPEVAPQAPDAPDERVAAPEQGSNEFDPGEHTVMEVMAHLETADDAEWRRVLDAEESGKGRKGILNAYLTED